MEKIFDMLYDFRLEFLKESSSRPKSGGLSFESGDP